MGKIIDGFYIYHQHLFIIISNISIMAMIRLSATVDKLLTESNERLQVKKSFKTFLTGLSLKTL